MDREKSPPNQLELTGFNESKLDLKIDLTRNNNIQGTILFSQKPLKKKKPFKWIRIRSFFIMHKKFKRMIEFSVHPGGIHVLHQAMFHSDNGCKMCRVYVEKNLFWNVKFKIYNVQTGAKSQIINYLI